MTTAMSSRDRPAVVTGAANGIGRAIALELGRAGHPLVLVDRDGEALDILRRDLGPRAHGVVADLTEPDATHRLQVAARETVGTVQILVNNAGIAPKVGGRGPGLLQTTDELWDEVLDVNLKAAFRCCRAFVPDMRSHRWGRVVNISSLGGRTRSMIAGPSYMASKAGMLGLTRSVAAEFAGEGITANCIAPGRIAGRLEAQTDPVINAQYLAAIPAGRFGRPDEVASLVAFLVSDQAGFMTGTVSDLNGGYFMA